MTHRWVVRVGALVAVLVWLGLSGTGGPSSGGSRRCLRNDTASFLRGDPGRVGTRRGILVGLAVTGG